MQGRGDVLVAAIDIKSSAALDALDPGEAAVVRDVARFRGPGRDRAEARDDEIERARGRRGRGRAVVEQPLEQAPLGGLQLRLALDEVAKLGPSRAHPGIEFLERGEELGEAGLRQRARAAQLEEPLHGSLHYCLT